MIVSRTDPGAFVRGKLHIYGIVVNSPLRTVLDVFTVIAMELPVEQLEQWRRNMDELLIKREPLNRDMWGLLPDQQAQLGWMNESHPS